MVGLSWGRCIVYWKIGNHDFTRNCADESQYNTVKYNMIVHTARQRQDINSQILNSQKIHVTRFLIRDISSGLEVRVGKFFS